jgi:hypothetical protein
VHDWCPQEDDARTQLLNGTLDMTVFVKVPNHSPPVCNRNSVPVPDC